LPQGPASAHPIHPLKTIQPRLTSIILATWEAEIGRITVPGQLRPKKKKGSRNPISKERKLGRVAYTCHLRKECKIGSIK
jgi:hypothetical protein